MVHISLVVGAHRSCDARVVRVRLLGGKLPGSGLEVDERSPRPASRAAAFETVAVEQLLLADVYIQYYF